MVFSSRIALMAAVSGCQIGLAAPALAADDDAPTVGEVIVTGVNSRLPAALESFPGSVTVINKAEIQAQLSISSDVGALLSLKVPGLATQSFSSSDFAQTLRGRSLAYYVDGVPISNPLRDGARSMRAVAASALSGVEVIRGASALYGNGGNGGAVNYITKRPSGPDGVSGGTQLSMAGSLTHFGGSANPSLQQDLQVIHGPFDLIFAGSAERTQAFYDADGDRIASDPTGNGGITDSKIYNAYVKGGFNQGPHRLEAGYMYYDQTQDTRWGRQVLGSPQRRIKTRAALGQVDPRVVPQYTKNEIAQVSYINDGVLGGTARLQGYHEENAQLFGFNAQRQSQSRIQSRKDGARLDLNTPLSTLRLGDGQVLWGVEYIRDRTVQTVNTRPARIFVPEIDQKDYAAFAQLEAEPLDGLTIQAGARYDKFDVSVEDFTVLTTGLRVQGGTLDYHAAVFNVGASRRFSEAATVYAGFSQGFSVPDVGLAIRATRVTNPLVALRPEAVKVDNYEIGLRGTVLNTRYTLAAFRSRSKLGQTFTPDPTDPLVNIVLRAAEHLHGVEATLDGTLLDGRLRWGGTYTRVGGKLDSNGDGEVDAPFANDRVGPVKVTGYVAYDIADGWPIRIQGVHAGDRNAFPATAATSVGNFGRIHAFTTFDVLTSHKLGPGELSVAVTNLFNKQYFPVAAQLSGNRPERYVPAPGATLKVSFRAKY